MLLKNCPALFSSYVNLTPVHSTHISWSHPKSGPWSCRHAFPRSDSIHQIRTYAQHAELHPPVDEADLLSWPEAIKPQLLPTPYQILRCRRGETYTKSRFYALVKLYHPDRCHATPAVAHLPPHVRLERYRMLVTAHDILSDVEKRRAYDAVGQGWAGRSNASSMRHDYSWNFEEQRWATDPRQNATWEDWERWRHENDGTKEPDARTIQFSNFAFMSLLFACVSIGGVMQGTRFNNFNNTVNERREQMHREASIELRRSKDATLSGDRDERIRTFLEHRESGSLGEPSYLRLLPPVDNCVSDAVRKQ